MATAKRDFLLPQLSVVSEERSTTSIDSGRSRLSYDTFKSLALVPLAHSSVDKTEEIAKFSSTTIAGHDFASTTATVDKLRRKKMRDWYNIAKHRSKQLGKKAPNAPITSVIHNQQAAKIYSLLCTVLQTAINMEKTNELEKFIRRKSAELPSSLVDLQELMPVLAMAKESRDEYVEKNRGGRGMAGGLLMDKDTILHLFSLSADVRKAHSDVKRLRYHVTKEVEVTNNLFGDFRKRLLRVVSVASGTKVHISEEGGSSSANARTDTTSGSSPISPGVVLLREEFLALRQLRAQVLDKLRTAEAMHGFGIIEGVGNMTGPSETDKMIKELTNLWNDNLIRAMDISSAGDGDINSGNGNAGISPADPAANRDRNISRSALALRRHRLREELRKSDAIREKLIAVGAGVESSGVKNDRPSSPASPDHPTPQIDPRFAADMKLFLTHASGSIPDTARSAAPAMATRGPAGELRFTASPLEGFVSSADCVPATANTPVGAGMYGNGYSNINGGADNSRKEKGDALSASSGTALDPSHHPLYIDDDEDYNYYEEVEESRAALSAGEFGGEDSGEGGDYDDIHEEASVSSLIDEHHEEMSPPGHSAFNKGAANDPLLFSGSLRTPLTHRQQQQQQHVGREEVVRAYTSPKKSRNASTGGAGGSSRQRGGDREAAGSSALPTRIRHQLSGF